MNTKMYYENRIRILSERNKENNRIIRKLQRKLRSLEKKQLG